MAIKRLKQSGISLIETLIAFAVISIVVMSIIRISVMNMTVESKTLNRTIAAMRAQALFERVNVNWHPPALQRTIVLWNESNAAMLPLGHGNISCNAMLHSCTVQVTWDANGKQSYAVSHKVDHNINVITHTTLGIKLQ